MLLNLLTLLIPCQGAFDLLQEFLHPRVVARLPLAVGCEQGQVRDHGATSRTQRRRLMVAPRGERGAFFGRLPTTLGSENVR